MIEAAFPPPDCGWKASSTRHSACGAIVPALHVVALPNLNSLASGPWSVTAVTSSGALPVFANVTEVEAAVVPTTTGGNASDVRAAVAIGVGTSTLLPASGMAVVPVLAVIVRLPERAPAAAGVKTSTAVQLPPGTMLVTQLLVEVNSGLGVAATCVMVSGAVPVLRTTRSCAVLVVATVWVAKSMDVRLTLIVATAIALPVPESVIEGLVVAVDWTVSVAVRVPLADGVNVALSVHDPPAARTTGEPLEHVPPAAKSPALVPVRATPEIVTDPALLLVIVTLAGAGFAFGAPTWVEPKTNDIADAVSDVVAAADGFAIYAAMSAASVDETRPLIGFISGTEPSALRIDCGLVPLRTLFMLDSGFAPWQAFASEQDR